MSAPPVKGTKMKWYKHESDDHNKIESKLIMAKFGAEGYGIYQILIELIAEYVDKDTLGNWGHVHPLHTVETLAEECHVTPDKLREFLKFCNDKNIFEKDEKGLYYGLILRRLDEFTEKMQRKSGLSPDSLGKEEIRREEIRKEKIRIDGGFKKLSEIPSKWGKA